MKYIKRRILKFESKSQKTLKKRKTLKKGGQSPGLEVRYPSGIVRGQTFTKEQTKDAPEVFFKEEKGKLYTILMWDPDAPAKPSWVHWIVTNLETPGQIHKNTVLSYQGPNPPSGVHRYYFGLFEQLQGKISPMISGVALFKTDTTTSTMLSRVRGGFDYEEFIRENSLNKVGEVYFKVSI